MPVSISVPPKLQVVTNLRNNSDLRAHPSLETLLVTKVTCKRILYVADSFCGDQKLSVFHWQPNTGHHRATLRTEHQFVNMFAQSS